LTISDSTIFRDMTVVATVIILVLLEGAVYSVSNSFHIFWNVFLLVVLQTGQQYNNGSGDRITLIPVIRILKV
jgi:hypothetical protein